MKTIYVDAIDSLVFTEDITVYPKGIIASDSLNFLEQAKANIKVGNVKQHFILSDWLNSENVIIKNVHQYLSFGESARRVIETQIYDIFFLWQFANKDAILDKLLFSETITVDVSKATNNKLIFTEQPICNVNRQVLLDQSLSFREGAIGYVVRRILPNLSQLYTIGSGVTFTYLNAVLTLPSPEFDNTDSVELTRINRKTRGGDLVVYRDNMWPLTETLLMRWDKLDKDQIRNLLSFLKLTLGRVIQIVDYNENTYFGIISKPEGTVAQKNSSLFSASLEFQLTYNW
jgi:hypothetical protein